MNFRVEPYNNTTYKYDPIYNAYVIDTNYRTSMPTEVGQEFLKRACYYLNINIRARDFAGTNCSVNNTQSMYKCPFSSSTTGEVSIDITRLDGTMYTTSEEDSRSFDTCLNAWAGGLLVAVADWFV
jgi:hypothetical protein